MTHATSGERQGGEILQPIDTPVGEMTIGDVIDIGMAELARRRHISARQKARKIRLSPEHAAALRAGFAKHQAAKAAAKASTGEADKK
jgi:hypothetical protein